MNNFSLWTLFTTDVVTTIASCVLVIFSVLSWAIIIEKIRLFRAARRNKPSGKPDEAIAPFDKNLWFLAMVAGVSPFIGLFGTVWGVMDSFASIGLNQSCYRTGVGDRVGDNCTGADCCNTCCDCISGVHEKIR